MFGKLAEGMCGCTRAFSDSTIMVHNVKTPGNTFTHPLSYYPIFLTQIVINQAYFALFHSTLNKFTLNTKQAVFTLTDSLKPHDIDIRKG